MIVRALSAGLLVGVFLTPLSLAQTQHAFLWTATGGMQDLGVPNGYTSSAAVDINNHGEIAATLSKADGTPVAAIWTEANGWRVLPSSAASFAAAINDAGQVAGESPNTNLAHAVLWTPGKGMQDLGTLGGSQSLATGINNSGQVVGTSFLSSGQFGHAFLWTSAGGMQDLGAFSVLPDANSWASGINSSGEIVGYATKAIQNGFAQLRSAVSNGGQLRELPITLGKSNVAYAVTDTGQVVGTFSPTTSETRAFSWTRKTGAIDLGLQAGSTGTIATKVNTIGQIVGYSFFSTGRRAFLWMPTGGFQDLGTLGGTTSAAAGINNAGQIVGYSDIP